MRWAGPDWLISLTHLLRLPTVITATFSTLRSPAPLIVLSNPPNEWRQRGFVGEVFLRRLARRRPRHDSFSLLLFRFLLLAEVMSPPAGLVVVENWFVNTTKASLTLA